MILENEIQNLYNNLEQTTKINLTQIGETTFIFSTKEFLKPLFYIEGNQLYLYSYFDIDFGLSILFESIDGNEQSLTFSYKDYNILLKDVNSLLAWFDSQI